jgi:hypothetical protein
MRCSSTPPAPAPPSNCAGVELLVAASDYSSSVLCGAPGCSAGPGTTGVDLGTDPMLSLVTNGRAFYLARDLDTVFELDPGCATPRSRFQLHDLARPNGKANAHDAAAAPDGTVVLPLYEAAKLAFVKDGAIAGAIDLSSYDADGNPQADAVSVVEVGGAAKAFVTLERLDAKSQPTQVSQMLRVDVATRTVEATINLAGRNPFNPMSELAGALYLAEPGSFDVATDALAGVERFDTATSKTALLVQEKDLGGSVSEVAVTAGCGVAIVAGPEHDVNPTALVTFDPDTGHVLRSVTSPVLGPTPGYDLQGLAWRDRTLYVGDRRAGAGGYPVHVLTDDGACTLTDTGRTIPLPQPPVALRAAASR